MARLVALDVEPGPSFVDALRRIWENGDAAFPVDRRLPIALRTRNESDLRVGDEVNDGDALVIATSGSTGRPKGVVLTHNALRAHAHAVHTFLDIDSANDTWTACLPLAHIGGLGVVVRAILENITLQVLPRFDDAAVVGTLISLVPAQLDRIHPDRVATFRRIVLGGSGDTKPRAANVLHTWGMTESGGGVVYEGRPLPGVEVKARDGELWLRSPTMLRCYRDESDPKTPDGWYPSGDLGSISADGTVQVAGRRDELIITGGENVWPHAVESALRTLDCVDDAVVIGKSDPHWGQIVVAYVVPTPGFPSIGLDQICEPLGELLPRFSLPKEVHLIDSIPRTALGKPMRTALRDSQ